MSGHVATGFLADLNAARARVDEDERSRIRHGLLAIRRVLLRPAADEIVREHGGTAWQDLIRPHELWRQPERWDPSYIAADRERSGWAERIAAWTAALAILTDAAGDMT